ncbi:sulfotransferase [Aquabacter spiritensis]|nr:sulfotransferase [Aquabacter spiritensis]
MVHAHRRSGTHFLIDTLRSRFDVDRDWFHLEEDFFARLVRAPVVIKGHERFWGEKIRGRDCWHSYLHWVAAAACYSGARHIHILRDPRAVLRSQFYFDLKGHEPAFRLKPGTSFQSYLRAPSARDPDRRVNQIAYWCAHVAAWLERDDVLHLRYEDLLAAPEAELARIGGFLGMPVRPAQRRASSAIGRKTSTRQAAVAPAVWSEREEALLMEVWRAFGLPDLGYEIGRVPAFGAAPDPDRSWEAEEAAEDPIDAPRALGAF